MVESTIGAYLANSIRGTGLELTYWRQGNQEVDFVLAKGKKLVAIEVKSGVRPSAAPGLEAFEKEFGKVKKFLIGAQRIPLEEFLENSLEMWHL